MLFSLVVAADAVAKLELVWSVSDLMNGLMAVPNLIGLLALSGVVAAETTRHPAQKRQAK